ncbi:MAG: hypothetical protein AAFX94_13130, partial [Myxococcota bacterium]
MCNHHPHRLLVFAVLGILGCGNVVSESGADLQPGNVSPEPGEEAVVPVPVEVQVPLTLDAATPLGVAPACNALLEGERVLSLSPEGDLWLERTEGSTVTFRVLGPNGDESTRAEEFGSPSAARALSGSRLDVVADSELWQLGDGDRTLLSLPVTSDATAQFCGDLTDRGLFLAGAELLESRDSNWWRSDLSDSAGADLRLLDLGGQCSGTDNFTWLAGADGAVWRLSSSRVGLVREFDDLASIAIHDDGVAVFSADSFWRLIDEQWLRSPVEGFTVPSLLAGAGTDLWFHSDGQLVRLNADDSAETLAWANAPDALLAYDGGLWIEGDGEVCHVNGRHQIRLQDISPFDQVVDEALSFELLAAEDAEVSATIEGEAVDANYDADGVWTVSGTLPHIGWNTVAVSVGAEQRTLSVKLIPANVVSYEEDIEPVFQAHCAQCHVDGGESVDLSTYDDKARTGDTIIEWLTAPLDQTKGVEASAILP